MRGALLLGLGVAVALAACGGLPDGEIAILFGAEAEAGTGGAPPTTNSATSSGEGGGRADGGPDGEADAGPDVVDAAPCVPPPVDSGGVGVVCDLGWCADGMPFELVCTEKGASYECQCHGGADAGTMIVEPFICDRPHAAATVPSCG